MLESPYRAWIGGASLWDRRFTATAKYFASGEKANELMAKPSNLVI
jgi:hypothetical protein